MDIWVVPASGGDATLIVEGGTSGTKRDLAWTSDGRYLTYSEGNDFNSNVLVTVDRSGEEIRRIRFGSRAACSYALSPDGRQLAFTDCGIAESLRLMGPIE
jgi:Tol biopolymer transport system component